MASSNKPAAKQGDQVVAIDTHFVLVPTPAGPMPTPAPLPFSGRLDGELSDNVLVENKAAAREGTTADNKPKHIPPPGTQFQKPPDDKATIQSGSAKVLINNKPAARVGDRVSTCADPVPGNGQLVGASTVLIGD